MSRPRAVRATERPGGVPGVRRTHRAAPRAAEASPVMAWLPTVALTGLWVALTLAIVIFGSLGIAYVLDLVISGRR